MHQLIDCTVPQIMYMTALSGTTKLTGDGAAEGASVGISDGDDEGVPLGPGVGL